MKQVIGYIVEKDGVVIGATADEREAIYIARNWKAVSFKVTTTLIPKENPKTEKVVAYNDEI